MVRANHPSDKIVAEVAWLYYIKGLNQAEIATRMGMSRPTVVTYLRLARERQIVGVKIQGTHFRINDLADRLCERYGLESALVIPDEPNEADTALQVCEAAAQFLPDFVKSGDTLGVSWGQTVSFVSERVPWWPVEGLVVRQLIGSLANPLLPTCESCTTEIARRLSAHCVNLNAPAVCTAADLADRLRAEPIIAEQIDLLSDCNKAIFSLSPCTFDTHVVQFNLATEQDISDYAAKGAVGIIIGRFIDKYGTPLIGELDQRMIGADLAALRKMEGLLVVSGLSKLDATRAALTGGYAMHVALDAPLAEALLRDAGSA
ncbi:sugar-binding transcriptional regulator [Roseinatronobacter alkalisoli]|uniref:Sugar-binding domain-containing protein n=1 Tax=Roseinatronobacter alkalisoli TaxID=3028235 RepID=A0ABT5TEJ4_9RHOB|nr:sugar-binding domain-containing protein [Roseinatronobacter sp. HJB301]MDD7973541.1 sugar-binding domain-containing protein [Roseinatronobacter sp. HJB301]